MSAERCRCPGCVARHTPFRVAHFRAWSAELHDDMGRSLTVEWFQEAFLEDLFGGVPEAWFILPEGNGKTTLVAAIALYHAEHYPGSAFVPVGAASREQAETLYRQGEMFVLNTPRLRKIFDAQPGHRRIRLKARHQVRIQVYAADENTGDSVIPTLAIIDEPHRQRDLGLYRTWRGKCEKRGGQIIAISTAGEPGTDFEQTRTRVLESTPVIERRRCFVRAVSKQIAIHDWAIPEKGDAEDLELVKEANPASWITVESLRKKRATPTMTHSHWRRYTCNRATRSEESAITDSEWVLATARAAVPAAVLVDLGLDAGWKWDTFAMTPLWQRADGCRQFGASTILTPPRDGNSLDPKLVKDALRAMHAQNPIRRVVMDITYANDIAAWIRDELGVEVIEHSQSDHQQAIDYERFMEGLRGGTLQHSGDAGLTTHAMNAIAKPLPGGKHKFDRTSTSRNAKKQERRVIDALVAAAMVLSESVGDTPAPAADLPAPRGELLRPLGAGIRDKAF